MKQQLANQGAQGKAERLQYTTASVVHIDTTVPIQTPSQIVVACPITDVAPPVNCAMGGSIISEVCWSILKVEVATESEVSADSSIAAVETCKGWEGANVSDIS